jgi:hypothetical protein
MHGECMSTRAKPLCRMAASMVAEACSRMPEKVLDTKEARMATATATGLNGWSKAPRGLFLVTCPLMVVGLDCPLVRP